MIGTLLSAAACVVFLALMDRLTSAVELIATAAMEREGRERAIFGSTLENLDQHVDR